MVHFLKLSFPIILSIIIHYLIPITDLLMISHLGMISVASVSISIDLSIVFSMFPAGVAYGLQPFIEKTNQKHLYKNTKWFYNSLAINLFGWIIFSGLLLLAIYGLPYLNQDKEAISMVPYYMPWLAYSIIPTMIYSTLCRHLEGLGDTKPMCISSTIGFFFNIILNYMFINMNIGNFINGLIGAGLATLLSRIIMTLVLIPYVWKKLKINVKDGLGFYYFDRQYMKRLLILGAPIGIQLFLEFCFFSFTSLILGSIGGIYKGANAILENIISLPVGISWGFSLAASTMVKQAFFSDTSEKRGSIWVYYGATGIVILLLVVCIVHCSFFIFTACYNGSPTDYDMIASSIPLAICFILVDAFYTITLGLLRGLKDTFLPFIIATSTNWLIGIPLCYLLIHLVKWGIPSIWLSKIIAFLISGIILFARFVKKYNEKSIQS